MHRNLMNTTAWNILPLWAPDDEGASAQGEVSDQYQDGTVAGAALALSDITLEDEEGDDSGSDDGDDGRQDSADDDKDGEAATDDAKSKDDAADESADGDDSEGEEEFFELPPEKDGEEPVRVAATQVWEGYQKSEELAKENAELKERNSQIPAEVDKSLKETIATRQQLVASLETWKNLQAPPAPDPEMLDQTSQKFDPQAYKEALDRSNAFAAAQEEAKNELAKQEKALQEEQDIRYQAVKGRADAEIKQFWPELIDDKATRAQFDKDMSEKFGATPEELKNTYDPRFFRMAKAALAYEKAQETTKKAVKIVRGKPKLVKGKARDSNSKRTSRNNAVSSLLKDGNNEDAAVAALETFDDI